MPITAEQRTPVERQQFDLATVPISELREHRQALLDRMSELNRTGDFQKNHDIQSQYAMVGSAIANRLSALEVDPQDRATLLNVNSQAAEQLLSVPATREPMEHAYAAPVREAQFVEWLNPERIGASQQTIHESFEGAVTRLESFTEGLSRQPDVSKELKETWEGFQQDTPTAPRSKTLGEATEALIEAYIQERTHEQEISPQRVSVAQEIEVSV